MRNLITCLLLVLAGCDREQGPTPAQKELRDMRLQIDSGGRQADECIGAIQRTPEYGQISDRFTLDSRSPMTILANKNKPGEADVPLLLTIHRQMSACQAQIIQNLNLAHPAFVTGAVQTFQEGDIDYARLTRREISW